jgi:signal transduction histidine kinase/AmiR/NasT family two-component response regulator
MRHDPSRASAPFRIGYEQSPPYQLVREDGSPGGPVVEILTKAAKSAHIPIVWVPAPAGPDASLAGGQVDLWPLVGDRAERRKIMHISAPWITNSYLIVSREAAEISGPGDLVGKTLAFSDHSIDAKLAYAYFPGVTLAPQPNAPSALQAVCVGKTDAGLVPSIVLNRQLISTAVCNAVPLNYASLPQGNILFGIGASFKRPDAVRAADAIRRQISGMAESGEVSAIFFRYLQVQMNEAAFISYMTESQRMNRRLMTGLCVLSGLLLLFGWQTLRLRAARRLAEASERAAAAGSRAKSEFLANMSHEIRTPLNGVIGFTELALELHSSPEQRELLVTALGSAENLLSVINDILDFSKIEAGKLDLEETQVDMSALIGASLTAFALRAQQKQLYLTATVTPDCPAAFLGDPARLRQVLFNLLGNAIKFTERGEVVLRVSPVQRESATFLQFSVSDTGVGIPADQHSRLFKPFSQADASTTRRFGGTGLGLAISRRIVELMQGQIWLESHPGKGTTVYFAIPLLAPEVAFAASASAARTPHTGTSGQAQGDIQRTQMKAAMEASRPQAAAAENRESERPRGLRILLAEDNIVNQKLAMKLLERRGHTVMLAENGKTAVDLFEAYPFDLMLMDVQMPEMDGVEATAIIREKESGSHSHIPIVAMTAHAMKGDAERCLAAGMDGYLSKSIKFSELYDAIDFFASAPLRLPGEVADASSHSPAP